MRLLLDAEKRLLTDEEISLISGISSIPEDAIEEYARQDPLYRIMKGRLPVEASVMPHVIAVATQLCKNPGNAVLWSYALYCIAEENNMREVTLHLWARAFADGVPTDEAYSVAWEQQKGYTHGITLDNLLDRIPWHCLYKDSEQTLKALKAKHPVEED